MRGREEQEPLDKCFLEAWLYFTDLRLFGTKPPRYVRPGPYKSRKDVVEATLMEAQPGQVRTPSGRDEINKKTPLYMTTGDKWSHLYFDTFYMNREDLTDRP